MIIDRIRKDMSVIAADDCCIGFVDEVDGEDLLRITSISAGYGYDHLIPLSWISDVDKYVYLDKPSTYVAANWEHAPQCEEKPTPPLARQPLAGGAGLAGAPKAA